MILNYTYGIQINTFEKKYLNISKMVCSHFIIKGEKYIIEKKKKILF